MSTTDPRVEFISKVLTQILNKFLFRNLDEASTSKSQTNINISKNSQKSKILGSAGEIIIGDEGRPVAHKCTMHNLPEPGQKIKILIMKYTVSLFLGVKNRIWNFGPNSKAKTKLYCQCSPIMMNFTPAGRYNIEDVDEVLVFIDVYCSW